MSRVLAVALAIAVLLASCARDESTVTAYVSLDRQLAEPVLQAFEESSGIKVQAVFDTEANKTSGLVNRLIAESARPRADVFWNNETAQMSRLSDAGVLLNDAGNDWVGIAARLRVLVINIPDLNEDDSIAEVRTLSALTDPRLKGRVAVANPHFGSTGTHFAALLATWGDEQFRRWLRDLRANDVAVLPGNAQVRDAVATGRFTVGLTDTDDAIAAIRAGNPIRMIIPDQGDADAGVFVVPNAIARVRGGPNPETARKLMEYLISAPVERLLAEGEGAQMPIRNKVPGPDGLPSLATLKAMPVNYREAGRAYRRMLRVVDEEWPP